MHRITRRPTAYVWPGSALALVLLAGCAAPGGDRVAAGPAAHLAHSGAASFAIVDNERRPVPDIQMGDPETIRRIIDEGATHNLVMAHLTYISTQIGPRLTGSTGAETANRWTRDRFESWGLTTPAFGGFEGQTSSDPGLRGLWQWGTVSARFDRGPSTGKIVAARNPGSDNPQYRTVRDVEFTTLAWTAGTSGPVRAPVVKMPETDEQFEASKDSIKGAWVLVKPNAGGRRGVFSSASARAQLFASIRKKWKTGEPIADGNAPPPPDVTRFEGSMAGGPGGPGGDGFPFTIDLKLADPSAVTGSVSFGNFRSTDITDAKFDGATHELTFKTDGRGGTREYTVSIDGDTLKGQTSFGENNPVTFTAKKVKPEDAPSGPTLEERVLALAPAGWIVPSPSELVITGGVSGWSTLEVDNLNPDVIVTVRQSDYDCLNSRLADGMPVEAEFDLKHTFTKGPIPVYNTIAEIRGTERPDEVVIVSGHLDSWNGPQSQGTTDNGTGSAVTLEAARLLAAAHAKPKRTIRFILWTGEEQGLLGSAAYVKRLKETGELERVSAVLVDDGGTNYEGGLACVESQVPYLAAATAPVNGVFYSDADNTFMDVNIRTQKVFNQISGSDHYSFVREKIPGFFWDESGRADYNHTHHTQHDRLDQAIPEYLKQSATCAAIIAYNLACAPDMLPRPTEDEWPQRGGGGNRRPPSGGSSGSN